jgi:hypothetical protein
LFELVSILVERPPDGPVAFALRDLDDPECILAMHPLPGDDPVVALVGLRTPPDWDGFGVLATGRARHLETDDPPEPVTVAVVAERGGATVDALRTAEGVSTSANHGEGRVPDAVRRVLGLPTAPPAHTPAALLLLDWVDRVLAAVLDADLGDPPAWAQLAALYRGDPHIGWSELRARCAAGSFAVPGLSADAAAWMDDGMFSREATVAYPPLSSSLRDLAELLPRRSYALLVDSLDERLSAA